jgi:hypothetical protein
MKLSANTWIRIRDQENAGWGSWFPTHSAENAEWMEAKFGQPQWGTQLY